MHEESSSLIGALFGEEVGAFYGPPWHDLVTGDAELSDTTLRVGLRERYGVAS